MKVAFAAVIACLLTAPVCAKTFERPDANPAVTVVLPDEWKPSVVEHGAEAASPDGETYVAVETATARGMNHLIDDDIQFLTKSGVTIDRSTQQSQDTTVNSLSVSFLHWKGTDKDGPTAVTLGIFEVSNNVVLLLTAWSSPAGDKANVAAMDGIVGSVKRR